MARIRTIKPEFFTSEDIVSLSPLARLLYIALWCEADREGRLEWKPRTFKIRYLPADDCNIGVLCDELISAGLIVVYGTSKFAAIPQFSKHQHLNPRESASSIPEMTEADASLTRADASNLDVHAQGGREGKGREGITTLSSGDDLFGAGKADPIPYTEILAAYHEHLPMLPAVRTFSDARRRKLRARWTESKERQSVEYWQEFFAYAALSDFLTGRNNAWTGCDFEWLIESSNHIKVSEGKYENKVAA